MKELALGIGFGSVSILLGWIISMLIKFPFESILVIQGVVQILIGGCNLIAHLGKKNQGVFQGLKKYTRNMTLMGITTICGILTMMMSMYV